MTLKIGKLLGIIDVLDAALASTDIVHKGEFANN
jgi:hypothetical protein